MTLYPGSWQGDDSLYAEMMAKLRAMPPEEKERMRRQITGEADGDLIQRGAVMAAIRSLRTDPVPSFEYQAALRDVQRLVGDLDPPPHIGKDKE